MLKVAQNFLRGHTGCSFTQSNLTIEPFGRTPQLVISGKRGEAETHKTTHVQCDHPDPRDVDALVTFLIFPIHNDLDVFSGLAALNCHAVGNHLRRWFISSHPLPQLVGAEPLVGFPTPIPLHTHTSPSMNQSRHGRRKSNVIWVQSSRGRAWLMLAVGLRIFRKRRWQHRQGKSRIPNSRLQALSDNTIAASSGQLTHSFHGESRGSFCPSSESLLHAHLLNASPDLKLHPRLYASRSFFSRFQSTHHCLTFYY